MLWQQIVALATVYLRRETRPEREIVCATEVSGYMRLKGDLIGSARDSRWDSLYLATFFPSPRFRRPRRPGDRTTKEEFEPASIGHTMNSQLLIVLH